MKNKYITPVIEVILIDDDEPDLMTTSRPEEPGKPGHGWGDNNHGHHHWKDPEAPDPGEDPDEPNPWDFPRDPYM